MPGPLGTSTHSPSIDPGTSARTRTRPPTAHGREAPPNAEPGPRSDPVSHYYVLRGDSLWSIAAHKLGDPTLAGALAALNRISTAGLLRVGQRLIVPDYRRYDLTVDYMVSQMVINAAGADARAIATANARGRSYQGQGEAALEDFRKAAWYEVFRRYGDQQLFDATMRQSGIATAEAMARWFVLVRVDGPWDHKPILRRMYESMPTPPRPFGALGRAFHFPIRGDLAREFYYDIWSNIHYGYVGTRCGFDGRTLQAGAASGFPGAGGNDEGDVISVNIGIGLWRAIGPSLTADRLRLAILSEAPSYEAARAREMSRGIKAADATNVIITNNDYK